jgi:hypothetical protein
VEDTKTELKKLTNAINKVMRKITLVLTAIAISLNVFAQKDISAEKYSATITADDLKKHLTIIASDEFEGRETGKEGQKKAAAYIKNQFAQMGLFPGNAGSYYQEFPMVMQHPGGVEINVNGKKYQFLKDFYYFPGFHDTLINIKEISFMGYGISDKKYDDYGNANVKGKTIMIMNGEPLSSKKISYVTGSKEISEWSVNQRMKSRLATEKSAAAVFVIVEDIKSNLKTLRYFIENPTLKLESANKTTARRIPVFYISKEMANEMLKAGKTNQTSEALTKEISKKGKSKSFSFPVEAKLDIKRDTERITSENVLGYIEGTDLKDELIVITGHYDHIGRDGDKIYNGADDDGSGTVSVMEIAEAFAKAKAEGKGPRRSILFMTVSGEEKGLFGSQYYVENPTFPLENTVANLNIDMVGRVDKKNKDNPDYIYLIGSDKLSTELHKISENANSTYTKLNLDYTYNHPDDPNRFYYRSDHYNFAKNNIPVIFYFNGTHEDYHKETDTVEKINFNVMEKRARLVFFTAWDLANRNDRIKVDVESDFK